MFIWILSLRLDLDYTTTSRKKKCLLILRGAVRVDYVTTGPKKKCLLILNLVKAVVMVDNFWLLVRCISFAVIFQRALIEF